MTEVNRIACPGCRESLLFRPEALEFPANCATCECRFSVNVYVGISCPFCHRGSKIRESYLGRHVRCLRCRHDFVSAENMTAGGGGRLLVARMLDTDSPTPPETVQPFYGYGESEAEWWPLHGEAAPGRGGSSDDMAVSGEWGVFQVHQVERLRAQAIAERDRLAHEAGVLKSILARLVENPPDPGPAGVAPPPEVEAHREPHDPGRTLVAGEAPGRQAQGERDEPASGPLAAGRGRSDGELALLRAELDSARAEADGLRSRFADEVALARRAAREAEERSGVAESELARVTSEIGEAGGRESLLHPGRDEPLAASIARLNAAVTSAMAGEAAAERRAEEVAGRLGAVDAELASERRRALELGRLLDELRAEIEAGRASEAGRVGDRDALAAALEELRRTFDEERRALVAEVERSRQAASEAARRAAEEVARSREGLTAAATLVKQLRASATEAEARHRAELGRLGGELAGREEAGLSLIEENRRLVEEVERARGELERPNEEIRRLAREVDQLQAEKQGLAEQAQGLRDEKQALAEHAERLGADQPALAEAIERLHAEKQALAEHAQGLQAEKQALADQAQGLRDEGDRLSAELEAAGRLREDNERLGRAIEEARVEADRRQGELASDLERARQEAERVGAEMQAMYEEAERLHAEKQELAEEVERLGDEKQALNERVGAAKQAMAEEGERIGADQRALAEAVEQLRAEKQALAGEVEEAGRIRAENQRLRGKVDHMRREAERARAELAAEMERARQQAERIGPEKQALAEAVEQLYNEKQALAGEVEEAGRIRAENQRLRGKVDQMRREAERAQGDLAQELERARGLREENARLANALARARGEAERGPQSPAVELVVVKKAPEPARPASGPARPAPEVPPARPDAGWEASRPIVAGAGSSDDLTPREAKSRDFAFHRDLAMTQLYGNRPENARPPKRVPDPKPGEQPG